MTATQSTGEAMDVLAAKHHYSIMMARYVAVVIALARGTVHSRQVRWVLYQLGIIAGDEHEFWLGTVFRDLKVFKWTGDWYSHSSASRNIHERTVKVWAIASVAAARGLMENTRAALPTDHAILGALARYRDDTDEEIVPVKRVVERPFPGVVRVHTGK